MPEVLYVFGAIMHRGTDILNDIEPEYENGDYEPPEDDYQNASEIRKGILDVCQDLKYAISGGKIIPS